MIYPSSLEELVTYVEKNKNIFFFTTDWCGGYRLVKPVMPETEEVFPAFQFIEVGRDQSIDVATEWNIFGIPSFVVIGDGQELGRLVNKDRETKEEISVFSTSLGQFS